MTDGLDSKNEVILPISTVCVFQLKILQVQIRGPRAISSDHRCKRFSTFARRPVPDLIDGAMPSVNAQMGFQDGEFSLGQKSVV